MSAINSSSKLYDIIISYLKENNYSYNEPDEYIINLKVQGTSLIPIIIDIILEDTKEILYITSYIPYFFKMDHKECALAVACASNELTEGRFHYNPDKKVVYFEICTCYKDSLISPEVFESMFMSTITTVQERNTDFVALDDGRLSFNEFINKL